MADASDSTPAPSRRGFFGSAVGAGLLASKMPPFAPIADSPLFEMEPGILACIAECDRILRDPAHDEDDGTFYTADMALLTETRALADLRATTLEGLMLKARFVERGDDDRLKDSIVADLLAMA